MKNKNLIGLNQQEWLRIHEEELIRAELNLCKLLSIWDTSKSKKKSKVIEQKELLPGGSFKIKRITIGGRKGKEAGIFTIKKHLKTFLALIRLYEDAGKPEKVVFGVHQLAEVLNLKWGSTTYQYLKEALEDLRLIPIIFENVFYNKETGEVEEFINYFTWLDDLKLYGKLRNRQPTLALSCYSFNKYIRQNILNGYTKPLFLTNIVNFKTEIAILLYNHLDLIMADKNCYERTLKNLIEVDFRLDGKHPSPSDRKQLFSKAIKELMGIKLTTGILTDIRLEKTEDDKDYKIVCRKSGPKLEVVEVTRIIKEASKKETIKPQDLVNYFHKQVDPKKENYQPINKELQQAQDLIDQYGADKAKYIINYALEQAQETNFKMKFFGAVINYTQEALNYLKKEDEYQKRQKIIALQQAEEESIKARYEIYRRTQFDNFKSSLTSEELKVLYKQAEDEFYKSHPVISTWSKEIFQMTVESNFNNWLEEQGKVNVLNFKEWRGNITTTVS